MGGKNARLPASIPIQVCDRVIDEDLGCQGCLRERGVPILGRHGGQ
jgi:hypothetical protein